MTVTGRTWKARTRELFDPDRVETPAERLVVATILTLIVASVVAVMLETVPALTDRFGPWFTWFEVFTVAVFTVEYAARVWSCTADERWSHPVKGRLRFALRPLMLVDLLAILPFYLGFLPDLRFVRVLRVVRMARLFKLARYSESMKTMGRVFRKRLPDLVMTLLVVAILLVLASSLMYVAEHEAQPEAFASIPHALWWAVVTLTTVGYGDVVPVTSWGRVLGAVIALLGIGLIALPAGILGSGFVEEIQRREARTLAGQAVVGTAMPGATGPPRQDARCPHCGRDLDAGEGGPASEHAR